jgi:hypothetical protein
LIARTVERRRNIGSTLNEAEERGISRETRIVKLLSAIVMDDILAPFWTRRRRTEDHVNHRGLHHLLSLRGAACG